MIHKGRWAVATARSRRLALRRETCRLYSDFAIVHMFQYVDENQLLLLLSLLLLLQQLMLLLQRCRFLDPCKFAITTAPKRWRHQRLKGISRFALLPSHSCFWLDPSCWRRLKIQSPCDPAGWLHRQLFGRYLSRLCTGCHLECQQRHAACSREPNEAAVP